MTDVLHLLRPVLYRHRLEVEDATDWRGNKYRKHTKAKNLARLKITLAGICTSDNVWACRVMRL